MEVQQVWLVELAYWDGLLTIQVNPLSICAGGLACVGRGYSMRCNLQIFERFVEAASVERHVPVDAGSDDEAENEWMPMEREREAGQKPARTIGRIGLDSFTSGLSFEKGKLLALPDFATSIFWPWKEK